MSPTTPSPTAAVRTWLARATQWRPTLSTEGVLLLGVVGLALGMNATFWRAALAGRSWVEPANWRFALALFVLFVALHFVGLALVATRHTVRPLLSVVLASGVLASHFMSQYGVVLDPSMLRNALATNVREASELFNSRFMGALGLALGLAVLPWGVQLRRRPWRKAAWRRAMALVLASVTAVAALLINFQDLSSLMRNNRALRYQVTPANVGWSAARVWISDAQGAAAPRDPPEPAVRVLPSVQLGAPSSAGPRKPTLLVIVAGETARAANFSLNGYARHTNPQLAQRDIVYFPNVTACGTSTEVSLPCMFSPFGRAEYDEARIRRHESLLHLLARAGLRVVWLDNQSGCKGVCDGLETHDLSHEKIPELCADDHCFDEVLLTGLQATVSDRTVDTVVVMHQLGNHGPAYFRRYPDSFKRFTPACESQALHECSTQEVINAYDNALLYTDHFLARTIDTLQALQARFDVALLYVSDHGESLGEHGLYLHGLPYAIAPREQKEVPMLWWLGASAKQGLQVDESCLRARTQAPTSHDHLFHSVLGLLHIQTPRYQRARDVFDGCTGSH